MTHSIKFSYYFAQGCFEVLARCHLADIQNSYNAETVFERLRSFSRLLGAVPSLVYALLYLVLIPGFAAVYYFVLPNDFYHSTAQFEKGPMEYSASRILEALQKSISKQVGGGADRLLCGKWNIDRDQIFTSRLTMTDEAFGFTLRVVLWGNEEPVRGTQEIRPMNFSFRLRPQIRTWAGDNRSEISESDYFEPKMLEAEQAGFEGYLSSQDIVNCLFRPSGNDSIRAPLLKIPGTLTSDIFRIAEAKRGFPSQIRGQFVRMLYLSASTITTLGYGDIVPLTTPARLAVSAEAVLGILVVGLFLNAVSKER